MRRGYVVAIASFIAAAVAAPPAAAVELETGRTALVTPASGEVYITPAGTNVTSLLQRPRRVRMGTVVDASRGTVVLRTTKNNSGGQQSGRFNGTFEVRQNRSRRPTTTLILEDPPRDECAIARLAGAPAAEVARRPLRRLRGNARGRFRSRGRHSSATVRGTTWITEDLCSGATRTMAVRGGGVDRAQEGGGNEFLSPGQSSEDFCANDGYPGISAFYCLGVLSQPKDNIVAYSMITNDPGTFGEGEPVPNPPRETDLCVRIPSGEETCTTYKFEPVLKPEDGIFIMSDACNTNSGPGEYTIRWRLGGVDLPVPVTHVSETVPPAPIYSCLYRPAFPGAGVDEPGNSYEP